MVRKLGNLALAALAVIFLGAGYKLASTLLAYRAAGEFYEEAAGEYAQPRVDAGVFAASAQLDGTGGETLEAETARIDPEKPRRATREKPPISVDFEGLLRDQKDVVGWLICEDTAINYPVVQAADNDYYLHRMPDGTVSSSGSIFMDASGDPFFADDNSIIYGHNMKNGSMFASLARYSAQDYFDAHPAMWLLTPSVDYKIELLAGFVTKADDEVYTINFAQEEEWEAFVTMLLKRSDFDGAEQPLEGDRFVTLSTCNYSFNNARYVVVGILVPVVAGA